MENRDTIELLAAFAAGALIGVGATLLLKPEPAFPGPVLRRLRESGKDLRRQARRTAHQAGSRGGRLARAGRDMLEQFRGEALDIVGQARHELARQVHAELRGKGGRRSRKLKR